MILIDSQAGVDSRGVHRQLIPQVTDIMLSGDLKAAEVVIRATEILTSECSKLKNSF